MSLGGVGLGQAFLFPEYVSAVPCASFISALIIRFRIKKLRLRAAGDYGVSYNRKYAVCFGLIGLEMLL